MKNKEKELYETTLSYTGPILPTKSLITNGHYFFKSPRNIDLNNKNHIVRNNFENKIINKINIKYYKNDSSSVKGCLQYNFNKNI